MVTFTPHVLLMLFAEGRRKKEEDWSFLGVEGISFACSPDHNHVRGSAFLCVCMCVCEYVYVMNINVPCFICLVQIG